MFSLHSTPDKFETTALFLWLCPPSTPIRHKNKAFQKCSSNWRNLKSPGFVLVRMKNLLKTELFKNNDIMTIM